MSTKQHGILVGYDGSPGSAEALAWAAREARARGSVLTLCHACSPAQAAPGGDATLAAGLHRAGQLMDAGAVRQLVVPGSAAAVLRQHSPAAEMVVVGSRGQGGLAGLLLGSVGFQVAGYARGRVVVVRGSWQDVPGHAPRPVAVGADGSAGAAAAVAFAVEEAALRGTVLLAVCALADAPGVFGRASRIRAGFDDLMGRSGKEHPELTVHRFVAEGDAREALLSAAYGAQLLVVGARGLGGLPGMALGSVSAVLVQHSPCPVAVVHSA